MRENLSSANPMFLAWLLAGVLHAAVMMGVRVDLPEPVSRSAVFEFSVAPSAILPAPASMEVPVSAADRLPNASEVPSPEAPPVLSPEQEVPAAMRSAETSTIASASLTREQSPSRQRTARDSVTKADAPRSGGQPPTMQSARDARLAPQRTAFQQAGSEPAGDGVGAEGSAVVRSDPPVRLTAAALDQQISEWSAQYNQALKSAAAPPARTAYVEEVVKNRVAAAAYERAWQDKVERVGNLNYPEEARRKNLTGGLTLSVGVNADGGIQSIRIRKSSGHPELDQAAVRIVQLAAPFSRFPSELKKDYDVLLITRNWRFFIDHHLSTSP